MAGVDDFATAYLEELNAFKQQQIIDFLAAYELRPEDLANGVAKIGEDRYMLQQHESQMINEGGKTTTSWTLVLMKIVDERQFKLSYTLKLKSEESKNG
jgi:hypothetical protein